MQELAHTFVTAGPLSLLAAEKKDAIDIATELCYSEEVKRKIAQAKSVYEIGRILKQARLDQE